MTKFEKYWRKALQRNLINLFPWESKAVKAACRLAYYAGRKHMKQEMKDDHEQRANYEHRANYERYAISDSSIPKGVITK